MFWLSQLLGDNDKYKLFRTAAPGGPAPFRFQYAFPFLMVFVEILISPQFGLPEQYQK